MSADSPPPAGFSRRTLLATLIAAPLGVRVEDALAAAASARPGAPPRALDAAEFADLRALCALILPTDEEPGALEAGVPEFIDTALASFFAARAADFRAGLAGLRAAAAAREPALGPLGGWPVERQHAFMAQIERTPFFAQLRDLAVLGLLASPEYGSNRGGAGWRLIGFADQHAFVPPFGYYDRDYPGFVPDGAER